jgi:branched-chain amino acid transport system permease protein
VDWDLIMQVSLQRAFGPEAVVFALAAVGLNMHFGYTGLVNFGQVAFLAVGAYTVAIGVFELELNFWLCCGLAVVNAVILAFLLGLPTLRLRADYLAIVTIASGEILRLVLRAAEYRDFTGGAAGIQNFAGDFFDPSPFDDSVSLFGYIDYSRTQIWVVTVGWSLVALACILMFLLIRSPWGRVIKAIREDEDAVRSLGKNVYGYKMQSLILGGVLGALGGIIFAIGRQSVVPDSLGTQLTFFAFTALVLGGAAQILGPVLGAIVFMFLRSVLTEGLREAVEADYFGDALVTNEVGIVVQIVIGLALMALMIFRPQGIVGNKREVEASARR